MEKKNKEHGKYKDITVIWGTVKAKWDVEE